MARVTSVIVLLFVLGISTPAFAQLDNMPAMSMPITNGTYTKPPLTSLPTHSTTGSSATSAAATGTSKPGLSVAQNAFMVDAWVTILSGICIGGVLLSGGF